MRLRPGSQGSDRLHHPLALVSHTNFTLANALNLPTFPAGGMRLYRRMTLILRDAVIEHVFYPVFPPDTHAAAVVRWLAAH
jgi:peroxiredoxin